ncbi:probable zinc transporter protein DDB_G0282067 [Musca vetustissima]|uniref:probable zinc transporter protein DDB_G0282067 n=1 Tax=Musca vetustissima TaxID=27455 RepID=UPI002AB7A979|nr:probable zinc transporter protein DDB_G0282067 [Musca vetustissima]
MRTFISVVTLVVIGVIIIEAAPHKHHDEGHGKATSYAVVTKHESSHKGGSHGDDGSHHGGSYGDHGSHKGGSHGYYGHGHNDGGHHGHAHGKGDDHGDDDHDYHSHPKYDFGYGVKDSKTGDVKDQWESRDGDKVKGSYSLKESDGTTRVVSYSSDKKSGFEASVHKIGQAHHDSKEENHHGQSHGGHGDYKHSGHGKASSYVSVKNH